MASIESDDVRKKPETAPISMTSPARSWDCAARLAASFEAVEAHFLQELGCRPTPKQFLNAIKVSLTARLGTQGALVTLRYRGRQAAKGRIEALGDDILDLLGRSWDRFEEAFAESFGRKPIPAEVAQGAETALIKYFGDELTQLSITVEQVREAVAVKAGDVFLLPFEGGQYGAAKILSDHWKNEYGFLVAGFDWVSATPLSIDVLRTGRARVARTFIPSDTWSSPNWKTTGWSILGNLPVSQEEFSKIEFIQGTPSIGFKVLGLISNGEKYYRPATANEAKWPPAPINDPTALHGIVLTTPPLFLADCEKVLLKRK